MVETTRTLAQRTGTTAGAAESGTGHGPCSAQSGPEPPTGRPTTSAPSPSAARRSASSLEPVQQCDRPPHPPPSSSRVLLARRRSACPSPATQKQSRDPTSLCLFLLLLGQLLGDPLTLPVVPRLPAPRAMAADKSSSSSVRKLFDPMIGEFCADVSPESLSSFFKPTLR